MTTAAILSGSGAASISAAIVLVFIGLAAWGFVNLVLADEG